MTRVRTASAIAIASGALVLSSCALIDERSAPDASFGQNNAAAKAQSDKAADQVPKISLPTAASKNTKIGKPQAATLDRTSNGTLKVRWYPPNNANGRTIKYQSRLLGSSWAGSGWKDHGKKLKTSYSANLYDDYVVEIRAIANGRKGPAVKVKAHQLPPPKVAPKPTPSSGSSSSGGYNFNFDF